MSEHYLLQTRSLRPDSLPSCSQAPFQPTVSAEADPHVWAKARNSATYVAIDSSRSLTLVWNLKCCTIVEGIRSWCSFINSSNSWNDSSPGLLGMVKLASCLYAFGPIMDSRTARFLSACWIWFAVRKCCKRSAYWLQFLCSSENSPILSYQCWHPSLIANM